MEGLRISWRAAVVSVPALSPRHSVTWLPGRRAQLELGSAVAADDTVDGRVHGVRVGGRGGDQHRRVDTSFGAALLECGRQLLSRDVLSGQFVVAVSVSPSWRYWSLMLVIVLCAVATATSAVSKVK